MENIKINFDAPMKVFEGDCSDSPIHTLIDELATGEHCRYKEAVKAITDAEEKGSMNMVINVDDVHEYGMSQREVGFAFGVLFGARFKINPLQEEALQVLGELEELVIKSGDFPYWPRKTA
jgi:hypothetical protein